MMAVNLLVKIVVMMMAVKIMVMMMAIAAFQRHRKRRGEGAPSSSCSLTSSLDGRRVSPLVLVLHGVGGARAPPRLDLSLYLSVFASSDSALSPFLKFPEIRNSNWAEILTRSLSGN